MSDFIRLFYTSTASRQAPDNTQRILTQSTNNNASGGITGVLLKLDGRYLQVLEGPSASVNALMERLQSDPRHHSVRIHFQEAVEERMFEGWAMASPTMGNLQIRATLELLTSHDTSSREIGLTYLKYWLTTQSTEPDSMQVPDAGNPMRVDEFITAHQRSKDFSIIAFCAAILAAVLMDTSFYLMKYLAGETDSLSMIHAHGVTAFGLALAIFVANRRDLALGVSIFQVTAWIAVALHILYAGYGIHAPSLPYLGLAIVTGIIGNKPDKNFNLLFACLGLIITAIFVSTFEGTADQFSKPVPLHHSALAGLLFPLVCALVLDAQRHRTSAGQRFSAHILGDLTKNIDRLKAAMTARNYFFSAISHEIRTPMAGASAAVALLKHPNATEAIKSRSLDSLDQSLANLNRLLNDLLDISKLESGHFQLATDPFDLTSTTHETTALFTPALQERGNTLELDIPAQAVTVMGDRMRYQQMLSNLLSNAIKFTDQGRINVRLSDISNSSIENLTLQAWKCEVSDSGIGIPQADLAHLFQPFSQASQHGYSKTKGTGLGLAIVANLAKQMGGQTGVESVEGKGSTFWFTFKLPRVIGTVDAQQAAAATHPTKLQQSAVSGNP